MALGLAAYVIIVSGLFFAIWKRPAVALAGVLCMFGLEQWGQATTPFFAQHQTITNLILGILLVLALAVQFFQHGPRLFSEYPLLGWLTISFFLYAFLSTQWAPRPDLSLKLWGHAWPYVVTLVVLAPLIIREPRDLESANQALLVIGGALTLLLLFFVKWEGRQIILGEEAGNPLAVAVMAGMVILVALLADPWKGKKLWLPLKWILVVLCLSLIVRSGSRGQLFSVLLVALLCWPLSHGLSNAKQFGILAFLVVFVGVTTNYALREFWAEEQSYYAGGNRWSGKAMEGAMVGRLTDAVMLVDRAYQSADTIIFGLGNSAAWDPRILGIYPHFVPLEILAEEGLIGFGLFVFVLLATVTTAIRCYRDTMEKPETRPLFAGLLALFFFTFLLSLKQGSLLGNLDPFMFAILLGRFRLFLARILEVGGYATLQPSKSHEASFTSPPPYFPKAY
ncbi:MAG: hypothetical protein P0121_06955 [Nitrospira sp.]|nr:hypothetical protein [Nitrospira sp.]